MTANTIAENRELHRFEDAESVWVFGYGSLIFKADFPYMDRRPARIANWERRFWQGSHDHRGTECTPGRVVTLIESPGAVCEGMAYRVNHDVFDHLDHREKNGYLRFVTEMTFENGDTACALVYIATEENAAFLGPAGEREIAWHIAGATGPSGRNRDYVFDLARALRRLRAHDAHVFDIEKLLLEIDATCPIQDG